MGKLTFNGKDITKPFTYNGKTYVSLTLKDGFGSNDGKKIALQQATWFAVSAKNVYKNGALLYTLPMNVSEMIYSKRSGNLFCVSGPRVYNDATHYVDYGTTIKDIVLKETGDDVYALITRAGVFDTTNHIKVVLQGISVSKFVIGKHQDMYIATDTTTIMKNTNVIHTLTTHIYDLTVDADDNVYYTAADKVYKNNDILYDLNTTGVTIRNVVVDEHNNVYYSTSDKKLYKNGSVLYTTTASITALSVDRSGNVYYSSGMSVYKNDALVLEKADSSINHIATDEFGARTNVWV